MFQDKGNNIINFTYKYVCMVVSDLASLTLVQCASSLSLIHIIYKCCGSYNSFICLGTKLMIYIFCEKPAGFGLFGFGTTKWSEIVLSMARKNTLSHNEANKPSNKLKCRRRQCRGLTLHAHNGLDNYFSHWWNIIVYTRATRIYRIRFGSSMSVWSVKTSVFVCLRMPISNNRSNDRISNRYIIISEPKTSSSSSALLLLLFMLVMSPLSPTTKLERNKIRILTHHSRKLQMNT